MGKIRITDLARMMGISSQDLIYKLKSIGVRPEGDDACIDTDIIQAILQGKKLPSSRETMLKKARRLPLARKVEDPGNEVVVLQPPETIKKELHDYRLKTENIKQELKEKVQLQGISLSRQL